jgi:hypothetical protein
MEAVAVTVVAVTDLIHTITGMVTAYTLVDLVEMLVDHHTEVMAVAVVADTQGLTMHLITVGITMLAQVAQEMQAKFLAVAVEAVVAVAIIQIEEQVHKVRLEQVLREEYMFGKRWFHKWQNMLA